MSPTTHTVIVAAVTSGVVTLVIEYLAKPRLEARKERLLAILRARQDLRRLMLRIGVTAQRLNHPRLPATVVGEPRTRMLAQDERSAEVLAADVATLSDTVIEPLYNWPSRAGRMLFTYVGIVNGIVMSERTRAKKGELIATSIAPVIDFFFAPRWKVWTWIPAIVRVNAFINEFDSDEPSADLQAEAHQSPPG